MVGDSKFITKLIEFGLNEKEARLYLLLLKYGPKPSSMLAKSLKTYREDVHRTLTGLIGKGMVNSSLNLPTVYAAVDLDVALDATLKKRESELCEMERKKQELEELSKKQYFRPSDEFCTFKIIQNLKELVAVTVPLLNSLEEGLLFVFPQELAIFASLYGINEESKKFIERGGRIRCILDISNSMIDLVQELLDIGYNVRHYSEYRGIFFVVGDGNKSLSALNVNIGSFSLDEPITMLWIDSPTYANYLTFNFEMVWKQAVPAAQRIKELLKREGFTRLTDERSGGGNPA